MARKVLQDTMIPVGSMPQVLGRRLPQTHRDKTSCLCGSVALWLCGSVALWLCG